MSNRLKIYACSGLENKSVGSLGFDWTTHTMLNQYLPDAASYFLYTYIPDNERYLYSKKILDKRKTQQELYKYLRGVFVPLYGDEDEFDGIIRGNIVATFNEQLRSKGLSLVSSPEEVLVKLRNGEIESVGIPPTVLAAIITAIATIIVAAMTTLVSYFLQKREAEAVAEAQAKYVVPDTNAIKDSVMEADDWDAVEKEKEEEKAKLKKSSSWLLMLALIPTAFYMLKKK